MLNSTPPNQTQNLPGYPNDLTPNSNASHQESLDPAKPSSALLEKDIGQDIKTTNRDTISLIELLHEIKDFARQNTVKMTN